MRSISEIKTDIHLLLNKGEETNIWDAKDVGDVTCYGPVDWHTLRFEIKVLLDELVQAAQNEMKIAFREQD